MTTDKPGLPNVLIRKYPFHIVICLLSLIFLSVLSYSLCQKALESYAETVRYRNAELNEIVYTTTADYDESFYNLGGGTFAFTEKGRRLSADILMTCGDRQYTNNPLYFKNPLPEGGCAVSRNLAFRFGLSVGDPIKLRVGRDEITFDYRISEILPAQSGVDAKYLHEGILILSENPGVVKAGKYIFTSFTMNGDEYKNLVDDSARGSAVIITSDLIRGAEQKLVSYALSALAIFALLIVACELLVFAKIGKKYRDYSLVSTLGIGKKRLFGKVYADMSIKYLGPLTVNFLVWLPRFRYALLSYVVPAGLFLVMGWASVTVITFLIVGRYYKCPKIKRLS